MKNFEQCKKRRTFACLQYCCCCPTCSSCCFGACVVFVGIVVVVMVTTNADVVAPMIIIAVVVIVIFQNIVTISCIAAAVVCATFTTNFVINAMSLCLLLLPMFLLLHALFVSICLCPFLVLFQSAHCGFAQKVNNNRERKSGLAIIQKFATDQREKELTFFVAIDHASNNCGAFYFDYHFWRFCIHNQRDRQQRTGFSIF